MSQGQLVIDWSKIPKDFMFICVDFNVVWMVRGRPVWQEPQEEDEEVGDWVDGGNETGEWEILFEHCCLETGPEMLFERPKDVPGCTRY